MALRIGGLAELDPAVVPFAAGGTEVVTRVERLVGGGPAGRRARSRVPWRTSDARVGSRAWASGRGPRRGSARLRRAARGAVARMVQELGIEIVPLVDTHHGIAVDAWLRFGKGRHPAALNFGDCLTYAVAKLAMQPLLCTGDDFARTDLELA